MAKAITERQQEIKSLLDEGKTPREIGEALGITENAVYQHIRRMRDNGVKVSTSSNGGSSRRSSSRSPSRPRATPRAAAPVPPTELRDMTPLQAIRARRDVLAHDVREAENAVQAAERALKVANEAREKTSAKHGEELKALDRAESAITGKPLIRPAKRRTPAKSAGTGNGTTPSGDGAGETSSARQQPEGAPAA